MRMSAATSGTNRVLKNAVLAVGWRLKAVGNSAFSIEEPVFASSLAGC
jgi:hypothetical protein